MQDQTPKDWLEAELQDTLDEDFEIEMEDAVLSQIGRASCRERV